MLIFIKNTPRTYAWGSRDALPDLLGVAPNGEPQAELWLGDHPGAPASVAKARPTPQTLIDLIESDPDLYGVDGQNLPFLMKLLGIGAPLSLQVHPDKRQAEAGFAREEAAGIPRDAPWRNYGDQNHKPELLVALSEVSALCGFRPLDEARVDLVALAAEAPAGAGQAALDHAAELCRAESEQDAGEARSSFMKWALEDPQALAATQAIAAALERVEALSARIPAARLRALRELADTYPGDPGVLISVLLHLVTLRPGEAVYLAERQLHAYLGGIAIEVMAASDNVLRAGLTVKHVDVNEVMNVVDTSTLSSARLEPRLVAPGLVAWQPDVPDFCLMRARLGEVASGAPHDEDDFEGEVEGFGGGFGGFSDGRTVDDPAESVRVERPYPIVLVTVEGRVRVERIGAELSEVASVGKGQSLYVSAGEAIELSGRGEVFLATVGEGWPRVSQPSSEG